MVEQVKTLNSQFWLHILKKSLMQNFIFCAVKVLAPFFIDSLFNS